MAYTDIDKPTDYFNTKLYTGNGSSGHAITGLDFQPDWIWIKDRGATNWHSVRDSVRGTSRQLFTNEARPEETASYVTAFNSDGFTLGTGNSDVNANNNTYASWNWKAGTSFTNDASSTGIGTIDSTGSFNNTPGFSIVSYTGTGSNGTVKHGLNSVVKLIILKNRTTGRNWQILHHKNTTAPATQQLEFYTDATATVTAQWNSIMPTSSVFSIGTNHSTNKSGDSFIAYCFAEKQGYSKFGSYSGNGNADGSFIYTGFKPAFLIIRRTDDGDNWVMFDNKRNEFNLTDKRLYPNSAAAEATASSVSLDLLSNGFKLRGTDSQINNSSGTYIYMAFAESPFVTSTGIPTTAR